MGIVLTHLIALPKTKYKFLAKIFSFKPLFIIFHYLYEFVAYFLFLKNKHQLNEETKPSN